MSTNANTDRFDIDFHSFSVFINLTLPVTPPPSPSETCKPRTTVTSPQTGRPAFASQNLVVDRLYKKIRNPSLISSL